MKEGCVNCKYYYPYKKVDMLDDCTGKCTRYYPPIKGLCYNNDAPSVKEQTWCGEWKRTGAEE